MADTIFYKIEEDGTITFETDGISGENHQSADEFLEYIRSLCGGECSTSKKKRPYNAAVHHHKHHHGRKAF